MLKILAPALLVTALLAAPAAGAQMSVIVLPDKDMRRLERLSQEGAIGLLVPDAGPETSLERAVAALQRGKVRNSLLRGDPAGEVLVENVRFLSHWRVDGPKIVLGLPGREAQPNDRRYPIAVIAPGYRGVLTSESTRIPGLVSIVDVAPTALGRAGKLGSTPEAIPVLAVQDLDGRIEDHRAAKMPVLLMSLGLIAFLAAFWQQGLLAASAGILLANLVLGMTPWTHAWGFVVVALFAVASAVFARLTLVAHGLLFVGVLAAYLAAMGIDAQWVALSPLGPTQNARFYGLSNLLATLLLVPALAGAAILGRRFGMWAFAAVAALALVTVGGTQFGADGGGVIVLVAGYGVLLAYGHGLSRRTLIAGAAVAAALAVAIAAGGESHVTEALRDGPAGLAEDLWRRLQLSWLRATAGLAVGLLVAGGVAVLAALAARERRPLLLAYLAAIAVSLLVNDSPNDVVLAGLAGYLALSSAPGTGRPAGERAKQDAPEPTARSAPVASP